METIHLSSCPVCSGNKLKKELTCTDFLVSNEKFLLLKCENCGFVFTQDFPNEEEIGRYYDTPQYISHSDTQKGLINSLYHFARKIAMRSKSNLVSDYSAVKSGKLLDIGSGTGYFLHTMCRKKWIVTGIEKSESARVYAHEKFGLNTQDSGYLFEIPEETKDIVTMWHVLEHIESLNDTMSGIYRILKKDGTAVIALPNKESSDARHYKSYWAAYDVPRHLWHFSPSDFELLAEKHNFKVEKIKPMYFDPFYISMLSEKYKGTFAAALVGLTKGFFFFLRSLGNKKKCSSLVYILKKK
ncbi:MAG TPA: methyltransferase [Dysgonomonas sp.]|nr:methyltransferase [Dysgonomonas sp.]